MPEPPPHRFVGRSRELLAAERLLLGSVQEGQRRYVVLRGEGGEGKTALACELARWLAASRRFRRAAFASLEHINDARALVWKLGEQLVLDFAGQAKEDARREWQLVERALRDFPTLLVIDNVESVLPPYGWAAGPDEEEPAGFDQDLLDEILELCRKLVETGETRLIFTSRSPLPAPFDDPGRALDVGRLSPSEALELVGNVLGEGGRMPGTRTDLESREKVEELVAVLGGHARSLVLIARELRGGQDHRGSAAHHGPPGTAASRQARAEPVRQRGAVPAQAAARPPRQAAAAGRLPRRGACRFDWTCPGARHREG
jgi:hypothetical protein